MCTYIYTYICATTQVAVLQIKNYQAFSLSETEGVIHLQTQLALNLYYSGQHFTLNPSILCLCYMPVAHS